MKLKLLIIVAALVFLCGCDTRHKATIYKCKTHHIVMKDDSGKWWEYTLKNLDIDFDIPFNAKGEMVLPPDGSWRLATPLEEEEVTVDGEATNAETTSVDETDAGEVDGSGDVGGDAGGAADGGGDGGGGDGGGGDVEHSECPCGFFYKGARCPDAKCKLWKKANGTRRWKLYAHADNPSRRSCPEPFLPNLFCPDQ